MAKAEGFGAKVTGIADGSDLETTGRYTGCGQVTRQVYIEDQRGRVHETVTADARAQAAAGEESGVGRRVHTVRHRRRQAAIGRIDPAMGTDLQQVKNLDMV